MEIPNLTSFVTDMSLYYVSTATEENNLPDDEVRAADSTVTMVTAMQEADIRNRK